MHSFVYCIDSASSVMFPSEEEEPPTISETGFIGGVESCRTPDNSEGVCTVLLQCPSLYKILEAPSPFLLNYLRRSICGYQGFDPKVNYKSSRLSQDDKHISFVTFPGFIFRFVVPIIQVAVPILRLCLVVIRRLPFLLHRDLRRDHHLPGHHQTAKRIYRAAVA